MLRWIALALFYATTVVAQTLPDFTRTTIADHADLLTAAEEDALHDRLSDLRESTGVELAVLTLQSQAPYAPDTTVEAFATEIFNTWGIGNARRNDGILVLILSEDRAMRIELGEGYGRDWDRVAADVINRSFLPAFAEEDYVTGINTGVDAVISRIAQPFAAGESAGNPDGALPQWMVFVSLIGAGLIVMRKRFAGLATRFKRCPNCGRRSLSLNTETLRPATRTEDGEGERVTMCSHCTYRHGTRFPIRARSKTHHRGSFGGGRSDGGGATGRW